MHTFTENVYKGRNPLFYYKSETKYITEELLLTPVNYNNISKRNMTFIKEALFDFIARCDRNI